MCIRDRHTIVPHSKAEKIYNDVQDLFAKHDALMEKHGIGCGFLLTTIAHNGFAIEPVFFTPDSLNEIHEQTIEDGVLKKMPCFESNPAASEVTAQIRAELIELFRTSGGIHMQIGKAYPYREGLRESSYRLVESVKKAVDPDCRINPGSLGLVNDQKAR